MNIAILSDLHGNIDALDAVVLDLQKNNVSRLFILGDIVGYYYYPEKILTVLEKFDCQIIRGNHEILLKKVLSGEMSISQITDKYGHGHEFALEKLSNEQIDFLINLPDELQINVARKSFLLRHANPWDLDSYIYPDTSTETLARCLSGDYDFVLIGHSHYSFDFTLGNKVLINPGSVGQNRKKGGAAAWVLLDTSDFSYRFMITKYSVKGLFDMAKRIDLQNDYLTKILVRE